jgi:coenzyme F420-reducing hydrogenase gamma subunit
VPRRKLAVWKFASCDGCQLSLLNCEDELLALGEAVDVACFHEATSRMEPGPYDVSLVDGSIATAEDAARIREIRAQSRKLVSIGACATAGGIQALRNFRDHAEMLRAVYARPEYIDSLATSTPIAAHVAVDFELRGCPIDRHQLLDVVAALLQGRTPSVPRHAVCLECKMRGHVCVVVAKGTPCLGPVTHDGCGALCPGHARGCYGCFGPSDAPETSTLSRYYLAKGLAARRQVERLFSTFNVAATEFREEAERHGDEDD